MPVNPPAVMRAPTWLAPEILFSSGKIERGLQLFAHVTSAFVADLCMSIRKVDILSYQIAHYSRDGGLTELHSKIWPLLSPESNQEVLSDESSMPIIDCRSCFCCVSESTIIPRRRRLDLT